MRKFLSILLAVMMVLSTVSFAAPSAIGSVQTADEYVAVETVPAEEAELEAELTAADASQYGTLLFEDTFDNATTDTPAQYQGAAALGGVVNDAFEKGVIMQYTFGGNRAIVTDGDNKYYSSTGHSAGYTTNSVYNVGVKNYHEIGPAGIYTFVYDLMLGDGAAASDVFTRFQQSNNAGGYNGAYKEVKVTPPATGVWTEMVHTLDASAWTNGLGSVEFYTLLSTGGSVNYDNIRIYYKPATANVTLNYNGDAYTAADVSTAGVKVDDLVKAANISFGIMKATGITDGTTTYALTDTVVLGGDSEFDIVAVADPSKDLEKGYTLWENDFNNIDAKTLGVYNDWVSVLGGEENTLDAGNIQMSINAGTGSITADKTLKVEHTSSGYKQANIYAITYNGATSNYHQIAPAGLYEFSVDVKLSDGATASTSFVRWCESTNAGNRIAGSNFHQVEKSLTANAWQTVTWTINTATDVTPWTNGLGTLEIYVQLATAGTIEYDNFKMSYKPYTVDVTLDVDGEKYVVEDVTTAGFDVAALANQAGIIAPAGKVAVASLTKGGETKTSMALAFDSTIYVTFIDDPTFNKKYGNTLALVDFEKYTVGDTVSINGAVKNYASIHNDADGKINLLAAAMGQNVIVADNGGKAISTGTSNGGYAQYRFQMSDYATRPDGYYTMTAKTKANASASIDAKVQGGAYNDTQPVSKTGTGTVAANSWTDIIAVYDGAYNDYTIYYNGASAPVAYDDIALYYKPKTVKVLVSTTEAGVENVTLENVSTLGVKVANLVADVDLGKTNKSLAGINFDGDFYALDETVIFAANSEVELAFGTSELFDAEKGTALALLDFDDAAVGATAQYSDFVDVYKGTENTLDGGNLQFVTGASRQVTADGTFKFAGGATYNLVTLYGLAGANYHQIAPAAGVYELNLDVKLSNSAALTGDGIFARWCESDNAGNSNQSNNYHQTGYTSLGDGWNTLKWTIDTTKDVTPWTHGLGLLQIYVQLGTAGDVEFDNLKLYYKPATVEVTIVDDDDNVIGSGAVSTNGVSAADIAALVDSGNPFETVTGITYGDTTYTGSDVVYLTRNATLVATMGSNPNLDQIKGAPIYDINFDSSAVGTALGYTGIKNHGTYTTEYPNVASMTFGPLNNSIVAEDGTLNWKPSSGGSSNLYYHDGSAYLNPVGVAGVYTFSVDITYDAAAEATPFTNFKVRFANGAQGVLKDCDTDAATLASGKHLEFTYVDTDASLAMMQLFTLGGSGSHNATLDNVKLWFKPATAAITGTFDGEVVKTVSGISTTDATVAAIVAAFDGGLYTITGFKYAGVTYDVAADADTVVAFPGASTIELVGTKSDRTPGTAVTSDESSIRLADDDKSGIRFKAGLAKADEVTFEAYGWFVTRKTFLEEAYPETAIADIDYDEATTSVTFVEGWNYDPEGANSLTGEIVDEAVINSEDDDFIYFTAVLFGIPETMYEDVLVAVPVTVVDGTWMYGAPVEKSIYEVACDVAADEDAYAALTADQQSMLQDIIDAVEA